MELDLLLLGWFLLLLLFFPSSSPALPTLHQGRGHHGRSFHDVRVQSLLPARDCSPGRSALLEREHRNHTTQLTVLSRGGPCSSTSSSSAAAATALPEILLDDMSRIKYLHRRLRHQVPLAVESSSLPIQSGRSLGTGNYVATISLGTPKRNLTVILDTGSDLTWVQCQPCLDHCHPQEEPLYDPALSSTFTNVSCPSAACSSLRSATGNSPTCADALCLYSVKYGDGSYSVGILSRDTLSLPAAAVPSFLFGCGHSNDGLFGRTAGLLGLGRDPLSAVSQSNPARRAFSYCLPTSASAGHLAFAPAAAARVSYTPMLTDTRAPSLYFLDLVAIRVGGRRLAVAPVVFGLGGTIIDSGTVITRLPPAAYAALRAAFRQGMDGYPAAAAYSILDTCFDLSGYTSARLPTVAMLFRGGAVLEVAAVGLLVGPSTAQLCLGFAANEDPTDVGIIGNMQQMTVEVVYDVEKSKIGFAPRGCA